jgi:hypothetical protein
MPARRVGATLLISRLGVLRRGGLTAHYLFPNDRKLNQLALSLSEEPANWGTFGSRISPTFSTARLWDFPARAEKTLHSETWQEHCVLRRSGVHYRLTEKSKRKLRLYIVPELKGPG